MATNPQGYNEIWFRGLSEDDRGKLRNALQNSVMSERLRDILASWRRELPVTKNDYSDQAWAYKQAHLNGMAEILTRLEKLFDQKESNV